MEKTDIKSLDYDELKDFFVSIGENPSDLCMPGRS